jgi:hypothetical protein
LTPSDHARGLLVGFSADVDLSRDPDDPSGALKTFTTTSFDLEYVLKLVGGWNTPFTLTARAFISIPKDGEYWFALFADDESCLAIDEQIVLGCQGGANQGVAFLRAGIHRFDLRFVERGGGEVLSLKWWPPGEKQFITFPEQLFIMPASSKN